MKIKNIIKQALTGHRGAVLGRKIKRRLKRLFKIRSENDHKKWILEKCESYESLLKNIDKDLYKETLNFKNKIDERAENILKELDVELEVGGAYDLAYFVTRLTKPSCVVETGVAAGFSSVAFLKAMERNGHGHLYSSDFPYFRIEYPERYIGILVGEKLKSRWSLYIEGDKQNLPAIKKRINSIDIFHYDSDKSYEGRKYAFNELKNLFSKSSIIMYDDIGDNPHFYEMNSKMDVNCRVFEFEGKHLGMLGDIK